MLSRIALLSVCALSVGTLFACAEPEGEDTSGPRVIGLSQQNIVVGETLGLYGRNLHVGEDTAAVRITFEGIYTTDDGREERVNLTFGAVADGNVEIGGREFDALRISRFGPFENPFSEANRPGSFEGTVTAEVEDVAGMVTRDTQPAHMALSVGPSLIIESFSPLIIHEDGTLEPVECGAPALRALGGIPYQLKVRPVGIKAVRFEYELNNINGSPNAVLYEHPFDRVVPDDAIGFSEPVIFNEVPADQQSYVTAVRVIAYAADGQAVETALPLSVHRPIEVVYGGKRELAERYEPVPVSGCIPGSVGSQVSYSESRTETRQKSVSVTVSQSWNTSEGRTMSQNWHQGIAEGNSRSRTLSGTEKEEERARESYNVDYTESEANRVGYESRDGEEWGWNMSRGVENTEYNERANRVYGDVSGEVTVSAEASGSIPGFAKVTGSASTTVGVRAGGAVGWTNGASRGNSSERGFSMGGSRSESRSFGSTATEARSRSINGAYALARSNSRTVSDTERLDNTRTWNVSEGVSENEVVSEGQEIAEQLTLVDTRSDRTVTAFSGLIPRTKVGIFYRQTTRWVRRAEVRSYNLCGLARHMGELQFNEWTWAPDLAIGPTCEDRPPPPNLEPATCLIQPCGG